MNLLITGPPRCGKTTLIKRVSGEPDIALKVGGFITEEIRRKGERIGFEIITCPDGKRGLLARKGLRSSYRLGRYGICLEDLENIGCTAIEKALSSNKIVVIDEIGKMELFSQKFRDVLLEALRSSPPVLATVMEREHDFADRIKRRADVQLRLLRRENFESLYKDVLKWIG